MPEKPTLKRGNTMKKYIALTCAVVLTFCAGYIPKASKADVGTITFSISASATGATSFAALSGQTSCQITTSGNGSGLSSTVQISPDNPVSSTSWATSGISTAITANGVSGGTVSTASIPVPTGIRFNVTALTSGTVTFNGVCGGGSSSGGGGGGGGAVTQSTGNSSTPWFIRVCDASVTTQCLAVDSSGRITAVIGNATPPTPYPNAAGAAPTSAPAVVSQTVCGYNTSITAPTTGQVIGCQVDNAGNLYINCRLGCGVASPHLAVNCTGTVGTHNLACAATSGAGTCANNTGTDTCTFTGVTVTDYVGMKSISSSAETVTLLCYNSASSTPPTSATLDANLLGITQAVSPLYGQPVSASNLTCQITGSGSINAGGITVFYN